MAFVIGIDFNDVLVNGAKEVIRIYNRDFQTSLGLDNWYSDFGDMTPFNTLDPKEVVKRVIAIQNTKEFSRGVKALEGAHDVLKNLKAAGHRLLIITGRPESNKDSTIATLERLFGDIVDREDLYFTDHYSHDGAPKSKGDIAVALDLTHFIDDLVDHVNDVAARGVRTLLFSDNYQWNKGEAVPEAVRVSSWKEIEEYFSRESAK